MSSHRTSDVVAPRERLDWVDTGRGIAILLVALYHSVNWMASAGLPMETWKTVNEVLSSLRMPLFFMLSGLFARKWQQAGWGELRRVKLQLFVWVLLVWSVIGMAVTLVGYTLAGIGVSFRTAFVNVVRTPLLPPFELWFMWALVVFFVVAKVTRRVDPRVQLAVAAVVSSIALTVWLNSTTGWIGSLKYYFFFAAGIHLRTVVLTVGSIRRWWFFPLALAGWAGVSLTLTLLGIRGVYPLYFLNCLAGLVGGIALSRLLSRVPLLRWLGARTLPVYLAHTPFIILMYALLAQPAVRSGVHGLEQLLPPVVAAVAVSASLLLHRFAAGGRLRVLYGPPDRLMDHLVAAVRRRRGVDSAAIDKAA